MASMGSRWTKLTSRSGFRNQWFLIRHDRVICPDGREGTYDVIETRGPSVFIVPFDENEKVVLIRIERYTTATVAWEVPGGNSDGEELVASAKRELKEETGLVARCWDEVGTWQPMNGICSEVAYVFLARNLEHGGSGDGLAEGILEVQRFSFPKVFEMIQAGEIVDGQSIVALTKVALKLKFLKVV